MAFVSKVLERCRGVKEVDLEYEDIIEAAKQSKLVKKPYRNIFKRKYRPQLVISVIFMFFQQFDVSASPALLLMHPTVLGCAIMHSPVRAMII